MRTIAARQRGNQVFHCTWCLAYIDVCSSSITKKRNLSDKLYSVADECTPRSVSQQKYVHVPSYYHKDTTL